MKENISVEAGKCCMHSLNETFRSVIRQVLFLRGLKMIAIRKEFSELRSSF